MGQGRPKQVHDSGVDLWGHDLRAPRILVAEELQEVDNYLHVVGLVGVQSLFRARQEMEGEVGGEGVDDRRQNLRRAKRVA